MRFELVRRRDGLLRRDPLIERLPELRGRRASRGISLQSSENDALELLVEIGDEVT